MHFKMDDKAINLAEFTVLGAFCTDGVNDFRNILYFFLRLNQVQVVEKSKHKIYLF